MIVINLPTDGGWFGEGIRKRMESCPRHVWTLWSRWCPIWFCTHCGAEGKIK